MPDMMCELCYFLEYEEDSEEESGKDWDELEEEAREGWLSFLFSFSLLCACVIS